MMHAEAMASPSFIKRRSLIIGMAGLGVILLVILFTKGALVPKQLQPDVLPIRLLSITPGPIDSTASFELRNTSGSKVDVWDQATLNVGSRDQHEVRETQITPITIAHNHAGTITVSVPNSQGWQLMLRVARHGATKGTIVYSDWSP